MRSRGLPVALLIVVAACSGENEPAQVTSGSLDSPPSASVRVDDLSGRLRRGGRLSRLSPGPIRRLERVYA